MYKIALKYNILSLFTKCHFDEKIVVFPYSTDLLVYLVGGHQPGLPMFPAYPGGGGGTAGLAAAGQLPRLQPLLGMSGWIWIG